MSVQFTNVGGACGIVEIAGKRILFDPWLIGGAFYGAWYHYPPLKMDADSIGRVDYIYLSHVHEDHCHAESLALLNRDAEIIVMDREPRIRNFVTNYLSLHGLEFKKIHKIQPRTPQEISNGLIVDMLEADPANEYNYLIDSGLILKTDDFVLYNSNDCPPYSDGVEYLLQTYQKVDFALLPYAAGSGYPACYSNLSEEEKMAESRRITQSALELFVQTANQLSPRYVMPFADQFVVAGSRSDLNRFGAHPSCTGAVADYVSSMNQETELVLLNSGQTIEFSSQNRPTYHPEEKYRFYSNDDRQQYIDQNLKEKLYDHEKIQVSESVALDRLLGHARSRLWRMQKAQSYFPDFRYYLEVRDRGRFFEIDFKKEEVREVEAGECKEPYLKISADATLLTFLLINHVSWNMADGALFLDYERVPNEYHPKVHAMLNHLII